MALMVPGGRQVGAMLVREYWNDMDEAHSVVGPKNLYWQSVPDALNHLLYSCANCIW